MEKHNLKTENMACTVVMGEEKLVKGIEALGLDGVRCVELDAASDDALEGVACMAIVVAAPGRTTLDAAVDAAIMARGRGLLTVGVVSMPSPDLDMSDVVSAIGEIGRVKAVVDSIFLVNPALLGQVAGKPSIEQKMGEMVAELARLVSDESMIGFDFNDVKCALCDGDASVLVTGMGEGENRVGKAIEDAVKLPAVKPDVIYKCKRMIVKVAYNRAGAPDILMGEIDAVNEFLNQVDGDAEVVSTMVDDPTLGDKVKVTIVASGHV